jgi:hypothetical protein
MGTTSRTTWELDDIWVLVHPNISYLLLGDGFLNWPITKSLWSNLERFKNCNIVDFPFGLQVSLTRVEALGNLGFGAKCGVTGNNLSNTLGISQARFEVRWEHVGNHIEHFGNTRIQKFLTRCEEETRVS